MPTLYILFLMLPIYWLVSMSFKNTNEILGGFTLWPQSFTLENYRKIFTDPTWYSGYINSIIYVTINTVISVAVALPAAYAFSRYRFVGDKHLFFWLLTNRMAPAAVFALPFFQLYSAIGLFDTHIAVALAHCLFNIPLAVWILEGFMSSVPKELDETAYVDGYGFWRFFGKIFIPTIAAGIGVAAFFCFMFSWVELLLAKTLTSVAAKPIAAVMTRTASTSGYELGLLAAAGTLTIIPGAIRDLFRAQLHRQGLRARARLISLSHRERVGVRGTQTIDGPAPLTRNAHAFRPLPMGEVREGQEKPMGLTWMAWTWETAVFFAAIAGLLIRHDGLGIALARRRAPARHPHHRDHTRRPAVHLAAGQRLYPPGLARFRRPTALGRGGAVDRVRVLRVSLGLRPELQNRHDPLLCP